MTSLADIALPVPIDHPFTYLVPPDLMPQVTPGVRVLVPFGRKKLTGVVVGLPVETSVKGLKPITDVLDPEPAFSDEMLKLTRWISEYYLSPWGEVLRAATPPGRAVESRRVVRLAPGDFEGWLEAAKRTARRQHAVLLALQRTGPLTVTQLQRRTGIRSIHALLNELANRGWIVVEDATGRPAVKPKMERIVWLPEPGDNAVSTVSNEGRPGEIRLAPKQRAVLEVLASFPSRPVSRQHAVGAQALLKKAKASLSTLKSLAARGLVVVGEREVVRSAGYEPELPASQIELNAHQQHALNCIRDALGRDEYRTFVLHGVTGSGKTQVYIESIRTALERGKTAIVLVPEISLTPQTVRRFKAHFGDEVTVMHSQMSVGERYDAWRLAHAGKVKIVIGPRSAVFTPLRNIGLIVVDEEHESSFKQYDATPRYHARDVAVVRGSLNNAVVLLGSATPSAESYHNALSGKYEMLVLPERVDRARMPKIEIVDMTKERKNRNEELRRQLEEEGKPYPRRFPTSSVSRLLEQLVADRLRRKEGIILLLNRRGFSHVLECFDCGHVEKCDNCEVTLTYHLTKKHLRCHYCGFVKHPPSVCPSCGGIEIRFHAFGTQQVQQELQELFRESSIVRMDLDTTSRKGAHDRILRQFEGGEADILLGTQMVAKGLDFPRVTLVGVISADTQMLLPDFRSAERTYQLLTQVAGRAGRSTLAGEVVIQTYQPDHYCLKHVVAHDFAGFYREELEYRRELDYPPFSRLVLVEFRGPRENEVQHHAKKYLEFLIPHAQGHSILLGPADAAIPKIKNLFRKHILIKNLKAADPGGQLLHAALTKATAAYARSALAKYRKVQMVIDVDPVGMM